MKVEFCDNYYFINADKAFEFAGLLNSVNYPTNQTLNLLFGHYNFIFDWLGKNAESNMLAQICK